MARPAPQSCLSLTLAGALALAACVGSKPVRRPTFRPDGGCVLALPDREDEVLVCPLEADCGFARCATEDDCLRRFSCAELLRCTDKPAQGLCRQGMCEFGLDGLRPWCDPQHPCKDPGAVCERGSCVIPADQACPPKPIVPDAGSDGGAPDGG